VIFAPDQSKTRRERIAAINKQLTDAHVELCDAKQCIQKAEDDIRKCKAAIHELVSELSL